MFKIGSVPFKSYAIFKSWKICVQKIKITGVQKTHYGIVIIIMKKVWFCVFVLNLLKTLFI